MDFSSRLPPKKAGHFPINESYNFIIINYTVGCSQVVVHEAHIWIGVGDREEYIVFTGLDSAIFMDVWIRHHVRTSLESIGRLDGV